MKSLPNRGPYLQSRAIAVLFAVIFCGFYLWISAERIVAPDEGYYLYAARMVSEGFLPYKDFFYPQAPLFPFAYGVLFKLFGCSWHVARFFSALLALITGALLARYCKRKWGAVGFWLAGLLYFLSLFVSSWYTTAQTYSLSVFFLFLSFYLLSGGTENRRIFLAGLFFGLSVETRLFFIALWPFFIPLFWGAEEKKGFDRFFRFSLGVITALLPLIIWYLFDPERVFYNNIGYHLNRSSQSLAEALNHKLHILSVIFGFSESVKFSGFQLALLLWAALLSVADSLMRRRAPDAAVYLAFGIVAISFLPTPPYVQYFSAAIPFLVVAAVSFLKMVYESARGSVRFRRVSVVIPLIFSAFYLYKFPSDLSRYLYSGKGVIGMGSRRKPCDWKIDAIRAVSGRIDSLDSEAEYAGSVWPGYLVETRVKAYPGLENHFTFLASKKLKKSERKKYHLLSRADLNRLLEKGTLPLMVVNSRATGRRMREALKKGGYRVAAGLNGTSIYQKIFEMRLGGQPGL
ncbi:MAG: hypothetical protein D6719_13665 [Candidatus Dadabacteria bacterium]|nr:MAG: hypothetical protein D6719_13665 [Candidatus Dadabacteria bacterium]